ncbi:putative phage abortive infection protein [Herbaspirillum seropedicae]|uniref:putative phage abortive infection protein n=1 Tax=Herbaspirillum seropedicae TaxID=964 RepID=UPI0012E9CDE5|nr:putative phage abortive infection protein [Herbaspirillum seropedicae]
MRDAIERGVRALLILAVLSAGIGVLWFAAHADDLDTQVAFCGAFVVYCVVVGNSCYRYLNRSIYRFVNPEAKKSEREQLYKRWFGEDVIDEETNRIAGFVAKLLLIGIVLILALFAVDIWVHFKGTSQAEGSAWAGPFGDFFGGVLNPILTFISFIALAFSFTLQRVQVRDGREQAIESKKVSQQQMFETTFFNLLALHNASAEQLHFDAYTLSPPGAKKHYGGDRVGAAERGRAVFGAVLNVIHMESMREESTRYMENPPPRYPDSHRASEVYEYIQNRHNYVLGHYFRNLYQILLYINEYAPGETEGRVSKSPKRRYASLLRAQLSTNELSLLYFNCRGTLVDNGEFRALVAQYCLLEHLPIILDHETGVPRIAGYGFEIDASEYFKFSYQGEVLPGAFGENKQIEKYLAKFNESLVTVRRFKFAA